jgi:uncharacterized protein involved in type VI secretion and phage assembly
MQTLWDWRTVDEDVETKANVSIATGTVTDNIDLPMHGKVEVRIPGIDQVVWARLAAIGAGPNAGFFYVPRTDDEVLVAFSNDDPTDAFVIGGLWNDSDQVPVSSPVDALVKRIIRSGLTSAAYHEIEMDDAKQSITITTTTKQKITLDPKKIELTNLAGSVTITLDNTSQSISIKAIKSIDLQAAEINLKGGKVTVSGKVLTEVSSNTACNIKAPLVKIN